MAGKLRIIFEEMFAQENRQRHLRRALLDYIDLLHQDLDEVSGKYAWVSSRENQKEEVLSKILPHLNSKEARTPAHEA